MNTNDTLLPLSRHRYEKATDMYDSGFTLVEILIAIVLVGILSPVAVVGISTLVNKGTTSSCNTSRDAARVATHVYFVSNANTFPAGFTQLTATAGNWYLTTTLVLGSAPTFSCSP